MTDVFFKDPVVRLVPPEKQEAMAPLEGNVLIFLINIMIFNEYDIRI